MFPIRKDRSLAPAACVIAHIGSGAHPLRQASAHPHQILIAPDRKHIYVSDLGLDCLKCYRADWTKQILIPEEQRDIAGLPGQGMRHGVFSKDGRFLYVMTELSCELNVFAFDDFALTPTLVQRCSCLPEGRETGAALGSGVRIHSNGQWLYCAVRGIDQILAFEIGKTGMLQPLQSISCGGSGPREFVLSPDGKFLLAGNQNTDNISVFEIDTYTGKLRPTGQNVECPCVTALAFAQL